MRDKEFNDFMEEFFGEAHGTQKIATQEYAQDDDKFANFKIIAEILQFRPHLRGIITPEDVAWVYRLKHIISRMKDVSLREDMRGRAIDDIVYGVILEGMRTERVKKANAITDVTDSYYQPTSRVPFKEETNGN